MHTRHCARVAGFASCLALAAACSTFSGQASAQQLSFSNQTDALGLTFTHTRGPRYGFMGAGGVAADFNNDGYVDLFVLGGGGSPDALFINNGPDASGQFSFSDRAAAWGIAQRHHSFGVSAADFNNDGYIDLYITSYGPSTANPAAGHHKLLRNNGPDAQGNWSFTNIAPQSGVHQLLPNFVDGTGSSWGDYDNDGDLDLFVCAYQRTRAGNRLFRNDGPGIGDAWIFTDVTNAAGLFDTQIAGFVPGFVDIDDSGTLDLLLVADNGSSHLFLNNGDGTFSDHSHIAPALSTANGMGSAVGDVNQDGLLDWYVSNAWYEVTQGPGNILMIQQPDRSFVNVAPGTPVYNGGWGWGTLILDLDHDGLNDLVATNGWTGAQATEQSYMLKNHGNLNFEEIALQVGFAHFGQGRGLIRFDFDNDGDLDIIVFCTGEPLAVFENHLVDAGKAAAPDCNWIALRFDTRMRDSIAPHAIGTHITVTAGGIDRITYLTAGFSHASQSEIFAHVGLGDTATIDAIRIAYPDGSFTTLTNVPSNQHLRITTPFHPADLDGSGIVDVLDVIALITRLQNGDLAGDHNGDRTLDFFDVIHFLSDLSSL